MTRDLTGLGKVPAIHARIDDSNGAVGEVMGEAMGIFARISPRLTVKPALLAERNLEAVADAGYGEFDGIIPAMAEALGPDGLNHLKAITEAWAVAPPSPQDVAQYRGYGGSTPPAESVRRQRKSTASIILPTLPICRVTSMPTWPDILPNN